MLAAGIGCQNSVAEKGPAKGEPVAPLPKPTEGFIKVQHILVSFEGLRAGADSGRTKAEAEVLANEILERAKNGEDFDSMMRQYSNDPGPGVYVLADYGFDPLMHPEGAFKRSGMVMAFGDVGFELKVGEIGMAAFDEAKSAHGWHIIKRLE